MKRQVSLSYLFFFIFICVKQLNAQIDISGPWQFGTHLLHDCESYYAFGDSNTFQFSPNSYDELSLPVWIKGTYRIVDDSIYFIAKIIYYRPLINIDRRNPKDSTWETIETFWDTDSTVAMRIKPSTSNYWQIVTKGIKMFQIPNPRSRSASFKYYKENDNAIIEIDGDKYYYVEISDDYGPQEE